MTRERNERAGKRVPLDTSGEIVRKDDHQTLAMCRVVNISSVGIQVESSGPVPPDQKLYVRFSLKDKPLQIPWDVVWTQDGGDTRRYGLRIASLDAMTKDRIRRYVNDWVQAQAKDRFVS